MKCNKNKSLVAGRQRKMVVVVGTAKKNIICWLYK